MRILISCVRVSKAPLLLAVLLRENWGKLLALQNSCILAVQASLCSIQGVPTTSSLLKKDLSGEGKESPATSVWAHEKFLPQRTSV